MGRDSQDVQGREGPKGETLSVSGLGEAPVAASVCPVGEQCLQWSITPLPDMPTQVKSNTKLNNTGHTPGNRTQKARGFPTTTLGMKEYKVTFSI